jgi:hypothetical protein
VEEKGFMKKKRPSVEGLFVLGKLYCFTIKATLDCRWS